MARAGRTDIWKPLLHPFHFQLNKYFTTNSWNKARTNNMFQLMQGSRCKSSKWMSEWGRSGNRKPRQIDRKIEFLLLFLLLLLLSAPSFFSPLFLLLFAYWSNGRLWMHWSEHWEAARSRPLNASTIGLNIKAVHKLHSTSVQSVQTVQLYTHALIHKQWVYTLCTP